MTKQIGENFKIRSVSDGSALGGCPRRFMTKQTTEHVKIRSVSDGSARGWGPARSKE